MVSFCLFLKEIVWAFLPVESKTNILYVNIKFTGSLFFGFGRYCGKVDPEPAVSQSFWAPAFNRKMFFQYFFRTKGSLRFCYAFFFKNRELLTIAKKAKFFCTAVFHETLYKISRKIGKPFCDWRSGNMTTIWFSHILVPVHH